MVGRPQSQGCETCRRRKKGCDMQRPRCNRCIRSGLYCEGYKIDSVLPETTHDGDIDEKSTPKTAVIPSTSQYLQGQYVSSDQSASLRRRRRTPKVSTGCKTCKARHVKCDEGRPTCLRCLKSSLVCDGYTSPRPILFDYEASVEERRRMRFFIECTVPSIETCSDADREFWTRTVLQISHMGSSVRHALLSIQAYHESLLTGQQASTHLQYAQAQYSKAIQSAAVAQYQSHAFGLGELAALSIVFRCIEVLRNDWQNAMIHLSAGRSIFDTAKTSNVRSDFIDALLDPMLQRLEFKSMSVSALTNGDIASDEGNIERAREKGHAILSLSCHGIMQYANSTPKLDMFLAYLRTIYKQWYREVCTVTQRMTEPDSARKAAIYCKIQYFLTIIALRAGTAEDNLWCDAMTPSFRMLITFCEDYVRNDGQLQASNTEGSQVPLSVGVELIAIAFFVGAYCRDSTVRARALTFLRNSKRREAQWHSKHAAAILSWIMSKEENQDAMHSPGKPNPERILLKKLRYFHAIQDRESNIIDAAISFQSPNWVQVQYSYDSNPEDLHEQWIRLMLNERVTKNPKEPPKFNCLWPTRYRSHLCPLQQR